MGLAVPAFADDLTDPRNMTIQMLLSGNGSINISNYVMEREETIYIEKTEYRVPVYYVDDTTTISFSIFSDGVVGDIAEMEWANGTYDMISNWYLGGEWGWRTLNALSLLDGCSICSIDITDLSYPIEEVDHSTTYASTGIYIRSSADLSTATGNVAFSDVVAGSYYADAVKWAVDKGITAGTSATTFSPNSTCTRGQIVTFLYRDLA